jgi:RNA polymerase sigma factor (sigma-70 family)
MLDIKLHKTTERFREDAVEQVLEAAARGDERAWDALVDRYGRLLWSITRSHRLDTADAADVFQTTWLRLVEHLPRLTTPGAVGAWLATTARRECLLRLGQSARCQPNDEVVERASADHPGVETELLRAEQLAALRHAMAGLSTRHRELLRLLLADPVPSYEEIGARLGMPIGSIGPTRVRALGRLRLAMEQVGHFEPAI